jgi:hypothetical protein
MKKKRREIFWRGIKVKYFEGQKGRWGRVGVNTTDWQSEAGSQFGSAFI